MSDPGPMGPLVLFGLKYCIYVQKPHLRAHADISSRLEVINIVCVFIFSQTLCTRVTKAQASLQICAGSPESLIIDNAWVKVFRVIPEFRILRLTFHRKSASKC